MARRASQVVIVGQPRRPLSFVGPIVLHINVLRLEPGATGVVLPTEAGSYGYGEPDWEAGMPFDGRRWARREKPARGVVGALLLASVAAIPVGVAAGRPSGGGHVPTRARYPAATFAPLAAGIPTQNSAEGTTAKSDRVSTRIGPTSGAEIKKLRRARSETFDAGGGQYVTKLFSVPVNFHTRNGFAPIDNTLVHSSAPGYALQNRANAYTVELPATLGAAPVRVIRGGEQLTYALAGASGSGQPKGSSDTFHSAFPGVDATYTAGTNEVKEALVLSSKDTQSRFTYFVRASTGLSPSAVSNGAVAFLNARHQPLFVFAPPYMQDAAGYTSKAVSMSIGRRGSGWALTVSADRSWLAATARRFPVSLDPSVTLGDTQDCYMTSGAYASTHLCDGSTVYINSGFDGTNASRALLQFDVSQIPSSAQVVSAQLGLNADAEATTTAVSLSAYPLTQSWDSGAYPSTNPGTTWNSYDGMNPWATAGGTFDATPAATNNDAATRALTQDWAMWYPTKLVQSWVNGSRPNYGLIIKETTENQNNVISFDNGQVRPSTYAPYLSVTYQPFLGSGPANVIDDAAYNDESPVAINVVNGNALLTAEDVRLPNAEDVAFSRTLNTLSSTSGDLGVGWQENWGDVKLLAQPDGTYAFVDPSAYRETFTPDGTGGYTPQDPGYGTLNSTNGTWTLATSAGDTYTFDAAGDLTAYDDANGGHFQMSYTSVNGVTSLAGIQDPGGTTTRLNYNADGTIAEVDDQAGSRYQYGYDTAGHLTSYSNGATGTTTTISYDPTTGMPTEVDISDGHTTKLSYDSSNRIAKIEHIDPSAGTDVTTNVTYSAPTDPSCTARDVGQTIVAGGQDNENQVYCYDATGQVTNYYGGD